MIFLNLFFNEICRSPLNYMINFIGKRGFLFRDQIINFTLADEETTKPQQRGCGGNIRKLKCIE